MKSFLGGLGIALFVLGCGAGHRKLVSIGVTPTAATAVASSRGTVEYTAKGTFDNNSTETLTQVDGLSWKTSNTSIATISDSGTATCIATGIVTVTATAPVDLTITVTTSVQNISQKISGSASLNCK